MNHLEVRDDWCDIEVDHSDMPRVHYRSGLVVYSESMRQGRLQGDAWNGSGFLPVIPEPPDPDDWLGLAARDAFQLQIDGVLLTEGWQWRGFDRRQVPGGVQGILHLSHSVRPIEVEVHTVLDGTAILTRWLILRNVGSSPAAVAQADPWSGVLWSRTGYEKHGGAVGSPTFRLGRFADDRWGHEGDFVEDAVPEGGSTIRGRYQAGPHRHPMFTVRAEQSGELFVGQLAWSGGYRFEFRLDGPAAESERAGAPNRRLVFHAGPDAPAPQIVLSPGEACETPRLHLGMVVGELDTAVQEMHRHIRRSVLRPDRDPRVVGLIESGIGPEQEMTEEAVLHEIDRAVELGAEVYFLDASWYAERSADWFSTAGDWQVADRYPSGLGRFRDRCREAGIRFGLWMEPERLGVDSRAFRDRPEDLARNLVGSPRRGQLNLSDPGICAAVEEQISDLITTHQLDFFRLDHNVGALGPGFSRIKDGLPENHYWRYTQNLYAMFSRLRERFPDVVFENCASGGARTDLGMVALFDHTWVTDWQVAPRSFTITHGMTLALPPELVDRHVSPGMNDHLRGELDFQCRLALFGRPTTGWLHPVGTRSNPHVGARVARMLQLYKDVVRPFQDAALMYHHSPGVAEVQGWGVLERSSEDRHTSVMGLFRLDNGGSDAYVARPRGVSQSLTYRVSLDNSGDTFVLPGTELVRVGIRVELCAVLTSELLVFRAVDDGMDHTEPTSASADVASNSLTTSS